MELVSVIVPVYNAEAFLQECLDSILTNTYAELEVIVIDDGSTDRSPQICDEYAHADFRIKVIHQENLGLIAARNAGLKRAHGTYVGFVDSDDIVSPIFFEEMVYAMEAENAKMVTCQYCTNSEKLANLCSREYQYANHFAEQLSVLTIAPSVRDITWTGSYVWNKLYRRSEIQCVFNDSCIMCEDLRFNWDYIQRPGKMLIMQDRLYMYRQTDQSILATYRKKKSNVKNGVANATLWAYIANQCPESEIDLKQYLQARAAYTAHGAMWRIFRARKEAEFSEFISDARKCIRAHCAKALKDKATYNFKVRIAMWSCSYLFLLWRLAARISARL